MTPRRRTVLAIIGVLAATAAGLVLLASTDDDRRQTPRQLDIPRAEQQARAACAAFDTFERQVKQNAPSRTVLATLSDARRRATDAADRDPRWRSLAGGADALGVALRTDNAAAARVGIDVVRAQCAELS